MSTIEEINKITMSYKKKLYENLKLILKNSMLIFNEKSNYKIINARFDFEHVTLTVQMDKIVNIILRTSIHEIEVTDKHYKLNKYLTEKLENNFMYDLFEIIVYSYYTTIFKTKSAEFIKDNWRKSSYVNCLNVNIIDKIISYVIWDEIIEFTLDIANKKRSIRQQFVSYDKYLL